MRKFSCTLMGALLLISQGLLAQTPEVSGKITDLTGSPVPNATVRLKSSKSLRATSADAEGAFKIKALSGSTLIISAIGFEAKEVRVGTSPVLNVQLSTDSKSLSEVVVTGVGTATSKRKLGIAVESVTSDKLPAAPTASIDQALIGKIPGAQISSISGNPGDPVNIVLRGINTVQGGTKPLIMVDGVQVSATDINSLDLSNVDRVEVVQGAASASIYGAQGANGVIQIFTKKGRRGAVSVTYSTSYSANQYINNGNVHKAALHPYLTDANNNIVSSSGTVLGYTPYGAVSGISYTYGGPTRYGILDPRNINNKAYNANLKYYDPFKEVFTRNDLVPGLGGAGGYLYGKGNSLGNVGNIYGFLNTSPFFSLKWKDAAGNYAAHQGADFLSVNAFNPYYVQEYASGLDNKIDVVQSFDADYKVNKFVELDAKYGLNYRTENARWTYLNQSQNLNAIHYNTKANQFAPDKNGEIDNWQYSTTFQNFLASAYFRADLQKDFGLKLPIQTSTQVSFDYRKTKYTEYDTYGLGLPLTPPINMASTSTQAIAPNYTVNGILKATGDWTEPFVTYGYLVNEKIDIGDWGGVSGGFRSDWSSAFGGGHTPFTFPHVDGYFLPSSILQGKTSDILPYWKLRAAYGEAGIQPGPFDRYPTLSQGNIGPSLSYSLPATNQNANLQLEVSKEC